MILKSDPEAVAAFSTQLLTHVIRNFVHSGIYPSAGAKTNVAETVQHLSTVLPEKAPVFQELGAALTAAIDDAEAHRLAPAK